MKRFLAALLLTLACLYAAAISPALAGNVFNPANATIEQLHAALDSHRITSEQLVRYYLDRIKRFDKQGPRINALVIVNPDALNEARRADAKRRDGHHRGGFLDGIPFVAKDNYDSEGIETSGGSAVLKSSVPAVSAFVLQRLLDAGAILIGKANMSELAASYGRFGYSSAGGLTLNPYNTARDVSGSSSGSAAAVAADFAAFALGTDTSGSIRGPAAVAGLVGLRPTLGLTSRSHVIPLSLSFDTTGALTRTVRDLAIVLDVIAGDDPQDAATLLRPADHPRYLDGLTTVRRLDGVRLGVIGNFRGANPEVDGVEAAALKELKSQGAELIPVTLPEQFETLWGSILEPVGEAEFKPQFERYLQSLPPGQPETLARLIEIYDSPALRGSLTPINSARLEALREAYATRLTDSPTYIHILTDLVPAVRDQLKALMETQQLRAFVFSTLSCPAAPRFDRADPGYLCKSTDPYKASYVAAAAGFPEITVPAGMMSANMPMGISFMGLPDTETRLLGIANAFEMARPRLPPPALH